MPGEVGAHCQWVWGWTQVGAHRRENVGGLGAGVQVGIPVGRSAREWAGQPGHVPAACPQSPVR